MAKTSHLDRRPSFSGSKNGERPFKKTGFKIGIAKKGSGVYLGKADKIKKTLIHKAKLKKQRARELTKAGYTDTEPRPSSSSSRKGKNRSPSHGPIDMESEEGDEGDEDMGHLSDEMEEDEKPRAARGRRKDGIEVDVDPASPNSLKKHSKRKVLASSPPPSASDSIHPSRRANLTGTAPPRPEKRRRVSDVNEVNDFDVKEKEVEREKEKAKKRREQAKEAWRAKNRNGQPKLGKRIKSMLGKLEKEVMGK